MEVLAGLLLAALVVVKITRARGNPEQVIDSHLPPLTWTPPAPAAPSMGSSEIPEVTDRMRATVRRSADLKFLQARWLAAEREKAAGLVECVPPWFFDEATPAQRDRLRQDGWGELADTPFKGVASDLIGMALPPTADQRAFLRRHNISTRNMSQSRARYEVADLEADPARAARLRNT